MKNRRFHLVALAISCVLQAVPAKASLDVIIANVGNHNSFCQNIDGVIDFNCFVVSGAVNDSTDVALAHLCRVI